MGFSRVLNGLTAIGHQYTEPNKHGRQKSSSGMTIFVFYKVN